MVSTNLIHFPVHHIPQSRIPSSQRFAPIQAWFPVVTDALSKMLLKLTSLPKPMPSTQLASCIDSAKVWKLCWTYPRMNLKQENAALLPFPGDVTKPKAFIVIIPYPWSPFYPALLPSHYKDKQKFLSLPYFNTKR